MIVLVTMTEGIEVRTRPGPRRRRRFALVACCLSLLLSALVGEGLFRVAGRRPFAGEPSLLQVWVHDPRIGFRNAPDAVFQSEVFGSTATTGHFGERSPRSGEEPSRPAIVFVGDSTTFCAEVNDDETGASQVAAHLPPALGVRVVNAGVRGHNTIQTTRMAEEWLARTKVRLVVYTFCENDLVENVVPWYASARSPTARLEGDALVIEEPGVGPETAGQPVFPRSRFSDLVLVLRQRSALFSDLWPRARRILARTGASGSAPPEDGAARRQALERNPRAVLTKLVAAFDEKTRAAGARLLVTRFTTSRSGKSRFWPQDDLPARGWEDLVELCRQRGIPCFDPAPAFGDDEDPYLAHGKDGTRDAHWGKLGAATWGAALAPSVIAAVESGR